MESSSLSGTSEWIINVPGNKVYPIRKAFIITYDEEEIIEEDGVTIEVIPIWKWLISAEK